MKQLRIICAWHSKDEPECVIQEGDPGAFTSHGMCSGCHAKWLAEYLKSKGRAA